MGRYLWGRLHHGVGRTVALLLGVLVATVTLVANFVGSLGSRGVAHPLWILCSA